MDLCVVDYKMKIDKPALNMTENILWKNLQNPPLNKFRICASQLDDKYAQPNQGLFDKHCCDY